MDDASCESDGNQAAKADARPILLSYAEVKKPRLPKWWRRTVLVLMWLCLANVIWGVSTSYYGLAVQMADDRLMSSYSFYSLLLMIGVRSAIQSVYFAWSIYICVEICKRSRMAFKSLAMLLLVRFVFTCINICFVIIPIMGLMGSTPLSFIKSSPVGFLFVALSPSFSWYLLASKRVKQMFM